MVNKDIHQIQHKQSGSAAYDDVYLTTHLKPHRYVMSHF